MENIFRIAICDDDEATRVKLNGYVKWWLDKNQKKGVLDIYKSGLDLLCDTNSHDLIFLDIEMPDIDGIETAKKVREINKQVPIVYATNYVDYQNLAFKVHAFEYLVKPIKFEEVSKILWEFMEYFGMRDTEKVEIMVRLSSTQVKTINVKDIYFVEYIGHKIMIKTKNGNIISRYYSMTQIFDLLKDHDFDFVHKGYIVNLNEIEIIKQYDIQMANQDIVPLAQKRASLFRERYNVFLQKILRMQLSVRG